MTDSTRTSVSAASYARWKNAVASFSRGFDTDKVMAKRSLDGIPMQALYTPADVTTVPHMGNQFGRPPLLGPASAQSHSWEFCQDSTIRDPRALNRALLTDLMCGQNCVAIVPDVATRCGIDPDHASSATVGAAGVSIADLEDLDQALAGVALDCVPIHFTAGADARPLAALFMALLAKRGLDGGAIAGSLTADPLSAWLVAGGLDRSLDQHYSALAEWTRFAMLEAPELFTVGISGVPWREAGGTVVEELAFVIASAMDSLRVLERHGVGVAEAASRIRFSFSIGSHFFAEVAKLRSFRLLWARIMSACGIPLADARFAVHARTGFWNKSLLDPETNMLRATSEACSAVLGGCNSLHIGAFDDVGSGGSGFSRRIARNMHTLLSEEFFLTATADPAGGSWYVERLTDDLARKAWGLFQDIERRGGMIAALREGYPQEIVLRSASEKRRSTATGVLGLVGVNLFPMLKEKPLAMPAEDGEAFQSERAQTVRNRRRAQVDRIGSFAEAIMAAREGATVGQLARALPTEMAVDKTVTLESWRGAEAFEALRRNCRSLSHGVESALRVLLVRMAGDERPESRIEFVWEFFAIGGFQSEWHPQPIEGMADLPLIVAAKVSIIALCPSKNSPDAAVAAIARTIRAAAMPAVNLVCCGRPSNAESVATLSLAGVDEFIHEGVDVPAILGRLMRRIEFVA